ncbi:MAG: hypothetical protein IPJ40_19645 [Saprospirales bacterium]|nr:hypothetical protein [Saprospirales bacterium]
MPNGAGIHVTDPSIKSDFDDFVEQYKIRVGTQERHLQITLDALENNKFETFGTKIQVGTLNSAMTLISSSTNSTLKMQFNKFIGMYLSGANYRSGESSGLKKYIYENNLSH